MTVRRLWVGSAALAAIVAIPIPALAHGIGGRSDLPVPLTYFLAGAATVLIVTFAGLGVLWPKPRLQQPPQLRRIGFPGWRWFVALLRVVGFATLVLVILAGMIGVNNSAGNPASVLVWVVFWLVVPFLGAVVGDLYRLLNPWDSLARIMRLGPKEEHARARAWGVWPATVVFVAFIWLELIFPGSADPEVVAMAAIVYNALMVGACEWLGRGVAFDSVDAFTTYNRLISAIAPLDLDPANGPRWRGWFRALPQLAEPPGIVAFVVAMIGTVSYDGLSATLWYDQTFGAFGDSILGGTLLLLVAVGVIGLAYRAACWSAARLSAGMWTASAVGRRFAHTLVPIALAYAFAHYFTLVVFEGQLIIGTISDPFNRDWDLFGTAGRPIDYTVISPIAVWWVQVVAIVSGHVAAVVLAHDRALADFSAGNALRSQYAMLSLMVLLTGLGLTILAAS